MSLLLAALAGCIPDRCDSKYEGQYCEDSGTGAGEVPDDTGISNKNKPEIDIDTDNDGSFDNGNDYTSGREWVTSVDCPYPSLSLLIRGKDADEENGASPPEIRVSIYANYVPEYLIDNFDTIQTVGDYVYLDPATYLTEVSPGIYTLTLEDSELSQFCDESSQSLYLRLEAFDGTYTSSPIDMRVDFDD